MKILYITYDGILDVVSVSQVLPYLNGLSERGHAFTLLSFEKRDKIRDKNKLECCREGLRKKGIEWMPVIYHRNPAIPATAFDILQGAAVGLMIARANKVDIIHARGYIAMMMACIIKKFSGAAAIFDMRGFWPEEKIDAGAWKENGIIYRILKMVERVLLRNAKEVVVLTETAKKAVELSGGASAVTAIPCCVDTRSFKPAFKVRPRPVMVYAGSLGTFYNLDKIFEFFRFIRDLRKDMFLRIVSQSSADLVRKTAAAQRIDESSYSVESVSNAEIPAILSKADFSVIFYRRRLSGAGCFPIKFSESLACGIPVIINSGIGDCDDIVNEYGVGAVVKGFSTGEYKAAAEKMDALLAEGEDARRRCRELAQRLFSIEVGVKAYEKIYERLERARP